MRFYSFFLLCCCLLSSACAGGVAEQSPIAAVQPPAAEPAVLAQSESPLITPEASATAMPVIEPVAYSEFGSIRTLEPRADYLLATIFNDRPQDILHILPDADIWIRNRIALEDVTVGEWAIGVDGYSTIVIFSDPSMPFIEENASNFNLLGISQIQAVDLEAKTLQVKLEDDTITTVQSDNCFRLFRQERATLADIEIDDWVQFNGILPDGPDSQIVKVDQMLTSGRQRLSEPVQTILACTEDGDYAHCVDEELGIKFERPTAWGTITSTLSESNYCGYAYGYAFSSADVAAGGRSQNFMEPRGGMVTDYGGDEGTNTYNPCSSASICEEVQPGVKFIVRVPEAQFICNPGPGVFQQPEAMVTIDIPTGETINGFIFIAPFLSQPWQQEIEQLEIQPGGGLNCQGEGPQQFDALMQKLVEQINTGTLDEETQANLQAIRHLAESIRAIE